MADTNKCEQCGSSRLVSGTLEGVSFLPKATARSLLSKGVYGITANACLACGHLMGLGLDVKTLEMLLPTSAPRNRSPES